MHPALATIIELLEGATVHGTKRALNIAATTSVTNTHPPVTMNGQRRSYKQNEMLQVQTQLDWKYDTGHQQAFAYTICHVVWHTTGPV